jgi:large conductance mechanosensitive channel
MRGNVIDMAVGIIIGGAFGKIVSSFVKDVLMPPIGLVLGRVDFSNLYINLSGQAYDSLAAAQQAGAPTINYGVWLMSVLDFVIIAFALFLMISQINRLKRQPPPAEPNTRDCPFCLSNIPIKATRCAHCTAQVPA